MKVYFTKKKAVLVICIILLLVIAAVPAGYFGYGATLLNPNSDRSIIASVSKLRHGNTVGLGDSAVEILAKKQYGDYFAVLFNAVPPEDNVAPVTYLSLYKKHKYYNDRYVPAASTNDGTETDTVLCAQVKDADPASAKVVCYIGNDVSPVSHCTLLEADEDTPERLFVRKLDEIALPFGNPYILVKEYQMQKPGNSVVCFDGSIDLSDLYGEVS